MSDTAIAQTVRLVFAPASVQAVSFTGPKAKAISALQSQHPRSTIKFVEQGQAMICTANQLDLMVRVNGAERTIWLAPIFKAYLHSLSGSVRAHIEGTMPARVTVEHRRGRGGTGYYSLADVDLHQWLDEIGKCDRALRKEIMRSRLWYKVRNALCDATSNNAALSAVAKLLDGEAESTPCLNEADGKWTLTVNLKNHDKPLVVAVRRRVN